MQRLNHLIRILYIQNDEGERESFSRTIAEKGLCYDVTYADTVEKARELSAGSFFELIIADSDLFDSLDFFEQAGDSCFILLTSAIEEPVLLYLLERGCDDCLIKDSERRYLDALPFTVQKTLLRREIDNQLRWTQARYSALFDRSLDLVYLLDLNGRFIDANPAALDLLGYTKEEIPSVELLNLVDPEQMPLARERMEQVLKTGCTTQPAEYKLIRKDGRAVFVETKGSVVLHDGKPVAIQGVGRNVTDRKRTEEAMRESEEKFRSLAENMNAAAGIVQGERFIYANQYMARMLGYSVDEILSLGFPQLVHPADREKMIDRARRRHMGESVPSQYEFRALTKSGEIRWIDFSVGSMLYRSKPAIIGTGIDITERKEAEERLTAHAFGLKMMADSATRLLSTDRPTDLLHEIFEELADHLDVKVFINYLVTQGDTRLHLHSYRGLDPSVVKQIEYIEFGQTLCGTVALERRPMVIENVQQSVWPETAPLRQMGIRSYACHPLIGHRSLIGTLSFCAEDRDRFNKEALELMRITSHQAAMALEHQRLADELARRAAELAEANAAKDHFLAVLSHELRTPLTPVVMGVSVLQDRADLDPAVRKTLDMVHQNVEMEARLIDDLLDVTRISRGKIDLKRSPVELCAVIQSAVEVCRPDIEARGLHLIMDPGPAAPYWVEADASRLEQVFWNLIKNSVKFTPHGGSIGIHCRPGEKHVVVEVKDSGIGIAPEALPRIFNAFEQTELSISRQFGGLGLGLAISKAMVELHGGTIEAHSAGRNQGAIFRINLPLCAPAGQSRAPAPPESGMRPVRPLHILLVEDHGATAQMIRMILTEKGHTVETADDVSTALKLADRQTFDLLLSDLGLPDGSGHDLIRELHARGKELPGIALSGYGQEADIRRSYESGFVTHLTKPASREAVVEAVEAIGVGKAGAKLNSLKNSAPAITVFDADIALERCFGKPETLHAMMKFFPAESSEMLGQMTAALSREDLQEVGRAAHRLKGTVAFLAAQPATNAIVKVEEAAKSGNRIETGKAINEMEHQIELLRDALASRSSDQG